MNKTAGLSVVLLCALAVLLGGLANPRTTWADEGDAYGPGMMGDYGYGMGPGRMGGGYGYGWHRGEGRGYAYGMMGGMGGYGMMGIGPVYMLDLTDAQRNKIHSIEVAMRDAHFALMEKMADEHDKLWKIYNSKSLDVKAAMRVYDRIFDLRKQMVRSSLEAAKQIEGVLTSEQREQMKNWRHGEGWGYHRPGNPPAGGSGSMMGR